jgi:8-oxo-dGTP diphosphatase
MPKLELTTMVMIEDKAAGKALTLDRSKSWRGLSFPGGHVEDGESFYDCAVREIKEERGLDIFGLKACGIIHWLNSKTFDRYLVFLYKTTDYSGELIGETDEGKNFWTDIAMLKNHQPPENGFDKFLPMFLKDKYSEAFGSWNKNKPWESCINEDKAGKRL